MKELKTYRDVLKAISEGHEVESLVRGVWLTITNLEVDLDFLDIDSSGAFRIKPTKPSINWEHVHPRYNYLARDKNGVVFLYVKEPSKLGRTWAMEGNVICKADSHSSLKSGTCDWTESLVKRPEGV